MFSINESPLVYSEGIKLLIEADSFRAQVIKIITENETEAVFWEFPPVTSSTYSSVPFEFVIIGAT